MENRSVFALDGLMGLVVAVLVLLGAVAFLVYLAIGVQSDNATNFYDIQNETEIGSGIMGKNASKRSDHIVDVEKRGM